MSKRGHAHIVEEKWMTKCNQEGLSPMVSEGRLNFRTMSARTKHRLEKRVDEMHGWALERSNEKVVALETQLEEETYRHVLEKEACHMRAKNQKKKDKDSLAHAEERQTRLEGLMVAAEVASKQLERQLRRETKECGKLRDNVHEAEMAVANLKEELTAKLQRSLEEVVDLEAKLKGKCDELTSMASHVQELQKRVRDVEAKWKRGEKKGRALTAKMAGLNAELAKLRKVCRFHNVICVLFVLFCLCFISIRK
jgi:chromosome segregation ATPase